MQINLFEQKNPIVKKQSDYIVEHGSIYIMCSYMLQVEGLVFTTSWFRFEEEKMKELSERISKSIKNSEVKIIKKDTPEEVSEARKKMRLKDFINNFEVGDVRILEFKKDSDMQKVRLLAQLYPDAHVDYADVHRILCIGFRKNKVKEHETFDVKRVEFK